MGGPRRGPIRPPSERGRGEGARSSRRSGGVVPLGPPGRAPGGAGGPSGVVADGLDPGFTGFNPRAARPGSPDAGSFGSPGWTNRGGDGSPVPPAGKDPGGDGVGLDVDGLDPGRDGLDPGVTGSHPGDAGSSVPFARWLGPGGWRNLAAARSDVGGASPRTTCAAASTTRVGAGCGRVFLDTTKVWDLFGGIT